MNRSIRYVLSTYGKNPGVIFSAFTEFTRAVIGRVVTVVLLGQMVAAITVGDFDRAKYLIVVWFVLTLVSGTLAAAGELVGVWSENVVYGKMSVGYYKKLTGKDMSFYRNSHSGALAAMHRQHVDAALILERTLRGDILRTVISLTFPAVVLLYLYVPIGLLAVGLIITQAIYIFWTTSKSSKYRKLAHVIYRKISGVVADDVTNIVAFKAAGKEKSAVKNMERLRQEEMNAFWSRRRTDTLLDFPRNVVVTMLVAVAFWVAMDNSANSEQAVGVLVITITYMFQIVRNVADMPGIIYQFDEQVTKLEPTLGVLTAKNENIQDVPNPKPVVIDKGSVVISDLTFKYLDDNENKPVFENLSINIKGGERVGIVGASGAGKSTLTSLLMRFDEIQLGSIKIDGVDIREVKQSDLRKHIAYVPQEPLLFHRTVKENIAYHNSDASDEEIKQAAIAAHAHEFIKELPKGYETIVGERGVKLSGGQKQRVVIARAVLKKAPILIFDEATSALDSESESIISSAMPKIIGKHTAIIIAHRLSTVASLDRIIVIDNGKIVEEGKHQALLKKKGRYYKLWQRQTESKFS